MTGAVLEMCSNTTALALPVARCGEARIGGLAVDSTKRLVYYASGGGLWQTQLDTVGGDVELAGALGTVIVSRRWV